MIRKKINRAFQAIIMVLLFWGLFFLPLQKSYSQEGGYKFFKNYTHRDYRYNPENLKIGQDLRGVIYAANATGVLEFDAVSWQVFRVPNRLVTSLAVADNGTVYIGGRNEIGFLTPDAKGTPQYVSLRNQLTDRQKNFSYVWPTYCAGKNVYFNARKFLFRWETKKKKMKVWESGSSFDAAFKCGETFFVYDKKDGLMQLVDDSLKPVPGGKTFLGQSIRMMVPYDSKRILMGIQSRGLCLYDGNKTVPFAAEANDYLKEKKLSFGIRLSSPVNEPAQFALATLRGGLVIIDANGDLKHIFNKTSGLQDNHVNDVFEDSRGNLWLALNRGISRIEYSSPFDIYDERVNLPGVVISVVRQRSILYVGTSSGLFFLSSSSGGHFQSVPALSAGCWSVLPVADSILAAGNDGVFQVQNNTARKIITPFSLTLYRSQRDNNRVWVGTDRGLVSLYKNIKNGQFSKENNFENETIKGEIRSVIEDREGRLWLGTTAIGVIKVDFSPDSNHPAVTRYYTSHGLPRGDFRIFKAAGHLMFASDSGIFRFDEAKNVFIPDRTLGDQFAGGGKSVWRILEDKNKNIWLDSSGHITQAIPRPDGSFFLNSIPFRRIPVTFVSSIYPDPDDDIVWFGSADGLIGYNTRVRKNDFRDFPVFIRKIQTIKGKLLVFGGYKANNSNASNVFPRLKYEYRNLHIEFAAPFFQDESRTTYQYLLEGHDKEWSPWHSETDVNFPDLAPGDYTFRVRAKNVYDHISREETFRFKILPPWYLTWWAFLGYALGLLTVIYLVVKWRSRKLEQEKQHLEQIVIDRTKEIKEKNRQLEEQSRQLQEMDKVKSRFFANISHEFRTPLTLIMGPLEQILSDSNDSELKQKARLMLRNSQRLLNLVNQLLELARFDSGKMKLQVSCRDIVPFLKNIAASFESLAVQNKLELTFQADEQEIPVYFEPEKLDKVICNLVANAIKFTPPGGKIRVSVKRNSGKEVNFPSGSVDISVSDTGMGILESQLEHIFERFYQAEGTYEHQQKGSGIGLSLTKELVSLHHGEIQVRSSMGSDGKTSGSEFIVRLPLGKEHLKPGEIIDTQKQEAAEIPTVDGFEYDVIAIDTVPEETNMDMKKEEPDTGEKNVILVVEDNADMRAYIRGALEPLYQVREAADGKKGMEKAREIIPDLIISDVMMPGADGYELCRVLKNDINTSHCPIILLTAKASEESVIHGLETGADDYIAKPFNSKILTARIKNLIDLRHQLQLKRIKQMALQPVEIPVSSLDENFYKELQGIIETNLSDPEFNVDQLHKKLYMSRTSVYKKILALTGEPPTQFIRSYRLQRAAQLLKARYGNVTEVAFAVGFSNTGYFAKCFKQKFHQLPSEFHSSKAH